MPPPRASQLFDVGADVLNTVVSSVTGFVTAQLGNVINKVASSNIAEWYYPPGFVGRPKKPGSSAAQVVVIKRGDNDAILGCRDERDAALVSAVGLDHGETLVFSPTGGGYVVFRKDKSVQLVNGNNSGSVTLNADGSVAVGDNQAAVLADGAAFTALWNQMKSCATTIDGACTFAGAPNVPPLATFFGLHPADKLQTTKAKGT